MSTIKLSLFGPPRLQRNGVTVAVSRRKTLALLAYLAVSRAPQRREKLEALFWPESSRAQAQGSLRFTLSHLRKALAGAWLIADYDHVELEESNAGMVDVLQFRQLLAQVHNHTHADAISCEECQAHLVQAVSHYQEEFLTGFTLRDSPEFDNWQTLQTEALRQELAGALRQLTEMFANKAEYAQAIGYAQRWLALDPLYEPAHRSLMQLYAWSGQLSAALRQYDNCVQLLHEELEAPPDGETTALYHRIRAKQGVAAPSPKPLVSTHPAGVHRQDWGEAPDVSHFYGREAEIETLRQWLLHDGCRLVAVVGMGGIGKTALAAKLAHEVQEHFEFVLWCSLREAPPLQPLLARCIHFLSGQQADEARASLDDLIDLLIRSLRQHRSLLILDNVEAILREGEHAGHYRSGYEGYGRLLQQVGETRHQSCVLVTSREKPDEFATLQGERAPVRVLALSSLGIVEGRALLHDKGLSGADAEWAELVRRYSGNPLALKVVAETIRDLFDGEIAAFLHEETTLFGGIRELLAQQFERLSRLEQALLLWLAVEREPVGVEELLNDLVQPPSKTTLFEALHSLLRRSLVERSRGRFTLQNVVLEYVTGYLVEEACREIRSGDLLLFESLALVKAQAQEYVRATQQRLIVQPVVERLTTALGKLGVEKRVSTLLSDLRQSQPHRSGYAGGNILNLLLHLQSDLRTWDFSHLAVRQVYLRGVNAREVNFSHSNLEGSVFTDTFGAVHCVVFSLDGERLAAATTEQHIRLWHLPSGRPFLTLAGHDGAVDSVCFSPDGTLLASGSQDQTARLWDAESGQSLRVLAGHSENVRSVCFSPDGTLLASGGDDTTVRIWDVGSGQCLRVLAGHSAQVRSVCFNADGTILASASFDQTVCLWDVSSGQCLHTLYGHTHWVLCVSFNRNGTLLASASEDQTVRVWDTGALQVEAVPAHIDCLHILKGHALSVMSVCFTPDDQTLASCSFDQTIRLWDAGSWQCIQTLRGHTSQIWSICFSPDGNLLASAGYDQIVRIWSVHGSEETLTSYVGQCLYTLQGHVGWVVSVCFSPDGALLASGSYDQIVRIWDATALQQRRGSGPGMERLTGHTGRVRGVCFSPDGRILASAGEDHTIRLWDVAGHQCLYILEGHTHMVESVSFSPDGRILASASYDRTIRLWDMSAVEGRPALTRLPSLLTLQGHHYPNRCVCFHPAGNLLASDDDGDVRIWYVGTGECLRTLTSHSFDIRALCFHPDGKLLACGAHDPGVRLWQLGDLAKLPAAGYDQPYQILAGHSGEILCLCFSPDGSILASGSDDRTVRLWDVASRQCLHTLKGHTNWVRSVCFSPNGRTLVSSSNDGTIKLWDIQTGAHLQTLPHDRPYERMNIAGVTGISEAQKATLKALGAVD